MIALVIIPPWFNGAKQQQMLVYDIDELWPEGIVMGTVKLDNPIYPYPVSPMTFAVRKTEADNWYISA